MPCGTSVARTCPILPGRERPDRSSGVCSKFDRLRITTAKDSANYARAWIADYSPYPMFVVNE